MKMVVASTITASSTSATVTSTVSGTNNDRTMQVSAFPPRTAFSNGNTPQERENTQDIPVPVTTYQLLLQQVESLKMENSSLKKELKNNTSHISKLKSEALNLKDMVLMLGQSMKGTSDSDSLLHMFQPSSGLGSQDNALGVTEHPHSLPNPALMRSSVGTDSEMQMCDSELPTTFSHLYSLKLNLRSQDYSFHSHAAVQSPTASSAVADEIRRQLLTLKGRRASIMKSLKMEEEKKGFYVKQMEELKYRLDCVSDSDQFVKPNDKTRQQIEAEIAKLQKTIEQSLGSPKVIDERGKMWLTQLQLIEEETTTLERLLRKLDLTPTSPENSDQGGSCTKHASYLHGTISYAETSTQTPEQYTTLDCITYEEEFSSCDNSMFDVQIVDGGSQLSRPTQTMASCLASRIVQNHEISIHSFDALRLSDAVGSKTEHKQPGSIESIPSQADIDETASMHSFTTSLPRQFRSTVTGSTDSKGFPSSLFLPHNKEEMSFHMWNMSLMPEGCMILRQNGCLSILVKLIHDGSLLELPSYWTTPPGIGTVTPAVYVSLKAARDVRIRASQTIKNIVCTTCGHDISRQGQILSQLEIIRLYCEQLFDYWIHFQTLPATELKSPTGTNGTISHNTETKIDNTGSEATSGTADSIEKYDFQASMAMIHKPPMPCITFIMRQSSDDTVRGIINELGGQFALAELFILHSRCMSLCELVYLNFGSEIPRADEKTSIQLQILRKYIGFALINLTYGDSTNKATLIQMPGLLDSVTAQIELDSEELQQVMAKFLRNLSWQPDESCRDKLKEKSVVPVLMKCALKSKRELTLHSILSALWNLSGHCQENRVSICSVKGALAFLISLLACRNPIPIVEGAGGILRNVSSVVATNEEYRQILREHNGLQVLLSHLTSPSLTIVSNACGTLWNLSARNRQDQTLLWELGAVKRLQNLVHSKHSVISEGSSGALRNLLANKPEKYSARKDSDKSDGMKLQARKQKNLESFLHSNNAPETSNTPAGLQAKHGWSAITTGERNKSSTSPKINLPSSQRRSFQETSSSGHDPGLDKSRRFPLGNIHYSGSVGSLPSSDLNESFGARQSGPRFSGQTASNSSNYKEHYSSKAPNCTFTSRNLLNSNISSGGPLSGCTSLGSSGSSAALKDVMMFTDPAQLQSQMHNRQLLTNKPDDNMSSGSPLQTKQQVLNMRQYFQLSTPGAPNFSAHSYSHHFSPGSGLNQSPLAQRVPIHPGALNHSDMNSIVPKIWPVGVKTAWPPGNHGPSPFAGTLGERIMMQQNQKPTNSQRLQSILKSATLSPLNINNSNAFPLSTFRIPGSKCPEDLARKLQNVEEDYDNDEPPKNYSQIYKEDNMTPGIQSPRTEEIYDQTNNMEDVCNPLIVSAQSGRHVKSQLEPSVMSSSAINGPATFSDGGLSGLSSCIGSNGSSNVPQRQDNNNNLNVSDRPSQSSVAILQSGVRFPTDPSLIDQYQYVEDEKPTDFGAMYSEESIGSSPFGNLSTRPMQYQTCNGPDRENGSLSGNQNVTNSASSPEASKSSENGEKSLQDEEGKIHSGGQGTITPGHSYHHRSGRNSGMNSGIGTPLYQETPMMFSRSSSLQSLNSCDHDSIHSDVTSDPGSRLASGLISPSQLPASPSQSMPESPRRSPKSQSLLNVNQPNQNEKKLIAERKTKELKESMTRDDGRLLNGDVIDTGTSSLIANGIENRLRKLEDPGYLCSLSQKDEMKVFQSNTAMSVVTTFSALTIDSNDKIRPLTDADNFSVITSPQSDSANPNHEDQEDLMDHQSKYANDSETKNEAIHPGQRAVLNAGYITSLPTSDEIKNFVHEGSLSPMTSFSEITCLKEHNDGFQRGPLSNISLSNSIVGSRSSATGASVPPPPPVGHSIPKSSLAESVGASQNAERQTDVLEAKERDNSNLSNITSPGACSTDGDNAADEDDDDDLGSSSSDENEGKLLLQACIQYGLPKKKSSKDWSSRSSNKSSASKSSSKSGKSSRSKDRSSKEKGEDEQNRAMGSSAKPEQENQQENIRKTNPSPEVVKERRRANIKQTLERANNRLKGTHIVDYIDKLMGDDRVESEGNPGSTLRTFFGPMKSKEVIGNAEMLQQSYSVKKHMKETEKKEKTNLAQDGETNPAVLIPKTTGFLSSELAINVQSSHSSSEIRIQRFLRDGLMTYATEGTPKEMSRSTSLSNLTIESESLGEKDFSLLQSCMKTSQSVPDFQKVPVETGNEADKQGVVSSLADKFSVTSSPTPDSRVILDNLSKQINNLTLKTAESVIERPHPGYMTSLPHSDEIKKYAAEGSQSGRTVFSALTIDSDTKIAPAKPSDLAVMQELTTDSNSRFRNANNSNENTEFSQKETQHDGMKSEFIAAAETSESGVPADTQRNRTSSFLSTEDTSYATSSSKDEVTVIHNEQDYNAYGSSSVQLKDEINQSSHYNNENDFLAMKERLSTYALVEGTPLNFSRNSSLSSLGLDLCSDDGNELLSACISSALPVEKKNPNPPPPNQLLNSQQMLHNHGYDPVHDFKFDNSTGSQIPYVLANSQYNPAMMGMQVRGQTFISSPLQSPNDEQWAIVRKDANTIAKELSARSATPSKMSGNSQSHSANNYYDSYYLSQGSMHDPDIATTSSGFLDHQSHSYDDSPHKPPTQTRKAVSRNPKASGAKSPSDRKQTKNTRKTSRIPSSRDYSARHSNSTQDHVKDTSSGSSSSMNKQRCSGNSKTNDAGNLGLCRKCHVYSRTSNQYSCTHHNPIPVSASTVRLTENVTSHGRRRSTNSGSNYSSSFDVNLHHHHPARTSRPRSSNKNVCRPSVIKLYPAMRDIAGPVGAMADAASEEPTSAQRSQNKQAKYKNSPGSVALVKQGTFIIDKPSPVLLKHMTKDGKVLHPSKSISSTSSLSPSHSRKSVKSTGCRKQASPRGSSVSLKSQSTISNCEVDGGKQKSKKKAAPAKQKHNKVWSGLKKLLSPSEDPRSVTKSVECKDSKQKGENSHHRASRETDKFKSDLKYQAIGKSTIAENSSFNNVMESGSSLSLSSSSISNCSGSEVDSAVSNSKIEMPFGHLPKSPSLNVIQDQNGLSIARSWSSQEYKSQANTKSVWRRTPPPPETSASKRGNRQKDTNVFSSSSSIGSCSSKNKSATAKAAVSMASEGSKDEESSPLWVLQKDKTDENNSLRDFAEIGPTETVANSSEILKRPLDSNMKSNQSNNEACAQDPATGFPPPPRTQSPRVVQQVAPFNYKPSPTKAVASSPAWRDKSSASEGRQINSDCKQTLV